MVRNTPVGTAIGTTQYIRGRAWNSHSSG